MNFFFNIIPTYKITNTKLEEEIQKISWKISTETDTSIDAALTSIKSLSYLKVINDEISGNVIKINWYISLNLTNWEKLPTPFWGTLEYKNWKLIVKEFSVSLWSALQINNILWIIREQKDYSIWEVYEYIHKNIKIYESNDYSITPCTLIMERLEKLNIEWAEVLNCNWEKMNIIKWWDENKVLYQIKMENYDIKSITTSSRAIHDFIDENFSWITTNATTISNIVPNIVAYQPKKIDSSILIWNSNAIIAIDDLSNYLGVTLTDIWERSWRVAAEFKISNITFIWVYDTNTKILWPIFLRQVGEEGNEDPIIQGFSLHLTPENQNEINKFLIEPVWYLYDIDGVTILKYLPEELEAYKKRISNE